MLQKQSDIKNQRYEIPIGIDYGTVDLFGINFAKSPVIGITGRAGEDRYCFTKYALKMLSQRFSNNVKAYISDSFDRNFEDISNEDYVSSYSVAADDIKTIGTELALRIS